MIEKGRRWFFNAALQYKLNVLMPIVAAGAPTDGTSGTGAGLAGIGSLYINSTSGSYYVNTGTKASPVWTIGTGISGAITPTTVAASTSVTSAGLIKSSSGTAGIGYATGAGGTVTQATSKSTGVTLSKVTGSITMNNEALGADAIASFTLTNTAIAATDALILNHISGGTVGCYLLNAQCGAGSAVITVTNVSAGSLTEAIVLKYALIKGVSA